MYQKSHFWVHMLKEMADIGFFPLLLRIVVVVDTRVRHLKDHLLKTVIFIFDLMLTGTYSLHLAICYASTDESLDRWQSRPRLSRSPRLASHQWRQS